MNPQQSARTLDQVYVTALQHYHAGRFDLAEGLLRVVVRAVPSFASGHHNLGLMLDFQERFDEAIREYQDSFALDPKADTLNNLAIVFRKQGRIEESLSTYRQALTLDPDDTEIQSNFLFGLHFDPAATPEQVFG